MTDGAVLYSDIYRPYKDGKFPILLHRTPYDKEDMAGGVGAQVHPLHAAAREFIVIVQDVRGRYSSQGKFNVFFDEIQDGYDAVQWPRISRTEWESRNVRFIVFSLTQILPQSLDQRSLSPFRLEKVVRIFLTAGPIKAVPSCWDSTFIGQ